MNSKRYLGVCTDDNTTKKYMLLTKTELASVRNYYAKYFTYTTVLNVYVNKTHYYIPIANTVPTTPNVSIWRDVDSNEMYLFQITSPMVKIHYKITYTNGTYATSAYTRTWTITITSIQLNVPLSSNITITLYTPWSQISNQSQSPAKTTTLATLGSSTSASSTWTSSYKRFGKSGGYSYPSYEPFKLYIGSSSNAKSLSVSTSYKDVEYTIPSSYW